MEKKTIGMRLNNLEKLLEVRELKLDLNSEQTESG